MKSFSSFGPSFLSSSFSVFSNLSITVTHTSQLSFVIGFFAEHTTTQNKQSSAASELKYIVVQLFSYREQEYYLFRLHEVSSEWITSMELSATIHRRTGTEDESIDKEDILDVLTVKLCTKNQSIRLFRPLEN